MNMTKILPSSKAAFTAVSFLPINKERKGEGGLRTQGYSKKSHEGKPLITIITVVYNGEKYLEETIQSVINQTYDNVEYIIIDGGSTDGTLDVIRKYENRIDYWVSEPDKGIYDAWNKGVSLSMGDWIAFLGADDFYLKQSLEKYVNHITTLKDKYDYISSKIELIDEDKRHIQDIGIPWDWKSIQRYMGVAHVGSLHHRSLFETVGLYDTSYRIAADYEMLLRKKESLKASYINIITAKMRNGGVSNNLIHIAFKETMRAKCETAERNYFIIRFEYFFTYFKFFVKMVLLSKRRSGS